MEAEDPPLLIVYACVHVLVAKKEDRPWSRGLLAPNMISWVYGESIMEQADVDPGSVNLVPPTSQYYASAN